MTIEETLAEREKQYGSFETFANIAQDLKSELRCNDRCARLADEHQEALEMILHKIARILNGDPCYPDNWHDIAGYATLVENILTSEQESND